jgi:hypothetical protein
MSVGLSASGSISRYHVVHRLLPDISVTHIRVFVLGAILVEVVSKLSAKVWWAQFRRCGNGVTNFVIFLALLPAVFRIKASSLSTASKNLTPGFCVWTKRWNLGLNYEASFGWTIDAKNSPVKLAAHKAAEWPCSAYQIRAPSGKPNELNVGVRGNVAWSIVACLPCYPLGSPIHLVQQFIWGRGQCRQWNLTSEGRMKATKKGSWCHARIWMRGVCLSLKRLVRIHVTPCTDLVSSNDNYSVHFNGINIFLRF